jgi:hypothetical protein
LDIENNLKFAKWSKIAQSFKGIPAPVRHTQVWLLVQIAVVIRLSLSSHTFYKKILFSAAIALIIIGLNYGKQWARIIASLVFLSMGLISLYYLISFIKGERPIDPVELIAFTFFALVSFIYIYLAIALWIGNSVQKHFHSSQRNSRFEKSVLTKHMQ